METGKHSRRAFLQKAALSGMGVGLAAGWVGRFSQFWVVKAEHGGTALTVQEMLTLAAIASQIIPTDETPGAREAGIVDFIDSKIKRDESGLRVYQKGLAEVNQASQGNFVALAFDRQKEVLKSMEESEFFGRVWNDIIEGFSRSSVGQEVMGYPGGAQPHGYHDIASPSR